MTIENELHHPIRRSYMYIYIQLKLKKNLILFILRGNFLRIFRKIWWYPCKIERKMDGERHEGSKINLTYFLTYSCLKVSSDIKRSYFCLFFRDATTSSKKSSQNLPKYSFNLYFRTEGV